MSNLTRYSKICDDCAKKEGGKCYKDVVCYNTANCVICGKETICLSLKDWNLDRLIKVEEVKDE